MGAGRAAARAPAYLVAGDDPSLVGEAARELVRDLVGEDDAALLVEEHGGEDEPDIGSVLDACATPPFLTSHRVVVLREAGRLRAEQVADLVSYLDDPQPTASLVLVAGGGTIPPKLANAVRRRGEVVDASAPSGRSRSPWLESRVRESAVQLDRSALDLLGAHLGEDLGRLSGMLEALTAAYGDGAKLGVEEVEPFLGEAGGVAPWDLTDAIDRADTAGALEALHRMTGAGGRHPLVVMATLHRHYAAMLRLDGASVHTEADAAAVLGARSTFVAGKALRQARRLGRVDVGRAITLLAAADQDLRGASACPAEVVMEILVARLSRLGPRPAGGGGRRRR
ncbi:MAG TPA: DNA polymerase III subunit delta [Acidimicrobiales bacterium]|nr:DNA polymerase III subunit delta [Acidimicrobiales bacterium]